MKSGFDGVKGIITHPNLSWNACRVKPLAFQGGKRIGTAFQPELGFAGDAGGEGVGFGAVLLPFRRGEADGVDFPAGRIGQAAEGRDEWEEVA